MNSWFPIWSMMKWHRYKLLKSQWACENVHVLYIGDTVTVERGSKRRHIGYLSFFFYQVAALDQWIMYDHRKAAFRKLSLSRHESMLQVLRLGFSCLKVDVC